MYTAYHCRTAN